MNDSLFPAPPAHAELFTAHCDGGSRGNPGPSGYGAVIEDSKGRVVAELSEFLGIQTNNFAEYSGLLGVLKWAVENGAQRLRVISDSELMVKQMQGKYKVASPSARSLKKPAASRAASKASRSATPSAAETSTPTASPTKPWTKAWEERRNPQLEGELLRAIGARGPDLSPLGIGKLRPIAGFPSRRG